MEFKCEGVVIPVDCSNCLNTEGYGYVCDRNPLEFEPEAKKVMVEKHTYRLDTSKIPADREIYCRNFLPNAWYECAYVNGRWIKIGKK